MGEPFLRRPSHGSETAIDYSLSSCPRIVRKARDDDKALGSPTGLFGHRDDYFLSHAEGGTNDSGATSETFAESFAMYLGTSPKWPKLEAFWVANPWDA